MSVTRYGEQLHGVHFQIRCDEQLHGVMSVTRYGEQLHGVHFQTRCDEKRGQALATHTPHVTLFRYGVHQSLVMQQYVT